MTRDRRIDDDGAALKRTLARGRDIGGERDALVADRAATHVGLADHRREA